MTKHAFGAKVTETSVHKCSHETVLYCTRLFTGVEKGMCGSLHRKQSKPQGAFILPSGIPLTL